MGILAIGLEHPLDVTFQRSHDPDAGHHRVTATAAQHQFAVLANPLRWVICPT